MSRLALFAPRRLGRLVASDSLNVARDPMLLFATILSLLPAPVLYVTRPMIDAQALAAFGVAEFSRFIVPIALIVPATLIGWVTGFLLLEDRDDGPLLAIDVTPPGKVGFLAYRGTITALLAGAITVPACLILIPEAGLLATMMIALLIAMEAVLAAAVLPAIARNKVEGLALTKLTNIAGVVPLLAIIPSPWRFAGGIVPTYWIGELLHLAGEAYLPDPAVAALAIASHICAAGILVALLNRRAG